MRVASYQLPVTSSLFAVLLLTATIPIGCGAPTSKLTESQEYYAGRAVSAQVLSRYPLLDDPELNEYVMLIGYSVALASDRPETFRGYVFGVLDHEEPNALAAPSGFIFLTKGLLKLCTNEDELAGVLAHEIAHVAMKHPELALAKATQTQMQAQFGMDLAVIAGVAAGYEQEDLEKLRATFGPAIDDVADALFTKGYERDQEFESDLRGVDFMSRTDVKYNPAALVDVLKRLATVSRQQGGWIGSTHPAPSERAKRLEEYVRAKGLVGTTASARAARFEQKTRRIR